MDREQTAGLMFLIALIGTGHLIAALLINRPTYIDDRIGWLQVVTLVAWVRSFSILAKAAKAEAPAE